VIAWVGKGGRMARPLRIEYEGAFYHIVQRGTERKSVFKEDKDKQRFLAYLETTFLRYRSICHAYCLMDNHYHLIIETPGANITKIMHYLNTSYAVYFNTKYRRVGPLYQGRFKSIIVQADEYLHHLSRYIHLNPVRAKIDEDPVKYKWSSYNSYLGKNKKPAWLEIGFVMSNFGKKIAPARKRYREYVLGGIGKEVGIIKENIHKGLVLGDIDFMREIKERFVKNKTDKEIPMIRDILIEGELSKEEIEKVVKEKIAEIKEIRKVTIYLLRKYTQKSLKDIADCYKGIEDSGISVLTKRMEERRGKSKKLNEVLASIEELLNVET